MLAILGCMCHNGITSSQRVLQQAGIVNWLEVPTYQGKEKALAFADQLGEARDLLGRETLRGFLEHNGAYSIIVGYNEHRKVWVNVGRGDMRSKLDGQAIAQAFAE